MTLGSSADQHVSKAVQRVLFPLDLVLRCYTSTPSTPFDARSTTGHLDVVSPDNNLMSSAGSPDDPLKPAPNMHKHADDKDNLSAPSHPADLMSSKENRITLDGQESTFDLTCSNGGNTGYHLTGRSTPPSDRLQRLRRRKRSEVSNAPRSPHYMTGRLPRKRRSTTQSKTSTRQQSGSGHLTSTESRSAATQTTQEQDGCDVATTDLEVVDESISHRSTPKADGGSTTH